VSLISLRLLSKPHLNRPPYHPLLSPWQTFPAKPDSPSFFPRSSILGYFGPQVSFSAVDASDKKKFAYVTHYTRLGLVYCTSPPSLLPRHRRRCCRRCRAHASLPPSPPLLGAEFAVPLQQLRWAILPSSFIPPPSPPPSPGGGIRTHTHSYIHTHTTIILRPRRPCFYGEGQGTLPPYAQTRTIFCTGRLLSRWLVEVI